MLPLVKRIIINGRPLAADCTIHTISTSDLLVIPTAQSVYIVGTRNRSINKIRYYYDTVIEYDTSDMIKIDEYNLAFDSRKATPSVYTNDMRLDITRSVVNIYVTPENDVYISLRNINTVYPEKK